jgi:hypothetical protein
VDYEPLSSLTSSNEFEERYLPPVVDIKEEEIESIPNEDESIKKKRGRPKGSIKLMDIKIEVKEEEMNSTDDEKADISIKRKRGRPKGSLISVKKEPDQTNIEIKQELNDDEPMKTKRGRPKGSIKEVQSTLNHNETSDVFAKRKTGRPRNSTKQIDAEIKQEEQYIEPTLNEDEKVDLSMKKRSRNSTKSLIKETEEVITTPTRRGRKRKIILEENPNDDYSKVEENEESSVDNGNLSIRRSSRPRKTPTFDPTTSKTNSQV